MSKTGAVWLSFDGICHKFDVSCWHCCFKRVLKWCCMLSGNQWPSPSALEVSPWIQPQFMQASEITQDVSFSRFLMDDSCQLPAVFGYFLCIHFIVTSTSILVALWWHMYMESSPKVNEWNEVFWIGFHMDLMKASVSLSWLSTGNDAGSPFQITIEGEWLDPDSDRQLLRWASLSWKLTKQPMQRAWHDVC